MKISGLLIESVELLTEHLGNLDVIDKQLVKLLTTTVASPRQLTGAHWKSDRKLPPPPADDDKEDWDTAAERKARAERNFQSQRAGYGPRNSWEDVRNFGTERKTNTVYKAIGRGSKLEDHKLRANELLDKLVSDLNYGGAIIKHAGKQVMIVIHDKFIAGNKNYSGARSKTAGYKETNTYSWLFTSEFLRKFSDQAVGPKKTLADELLAAVKLTNLSKGGSVSAERLKLILTALAKFEWAISQGDNLGKSKAPTDSKLPALETMLITVDQEREKLHAERVNRRQGSVAIPSTPVNVKHPRERWLIASYNSQTMQLMASLKYRLNSYKNTKTPNYDTQEELLQAIIDKGYVDKVVFMHTPYNLKEHKLDLKDLKLGAKGKGESFVEYESEEEMSFSDPRMKAAHAEIEERVNAFKKKAPPLPKTWQETADKTEDEAEKAKVLDRWIDGWAEEQVDKQQRAELYLKHGLKPAKLKITFVLEGGKIVPFKVLMKFSRYE